jgi:hypothetical protein
MTAPATPAAAPAATLAAGGHAAHAATAGSLWLGHVLPGVLLLAYVAGVTWLFVWLLRRSDVDGDEGDDDGGGGLRIDPTPPRPVPSPDSEPEWWPQFERDFAAHVEKIRVAP